MKSTMRFLWALILYSVCVDSGSFAAQFAEYFPLDPAVHGLKTFEWTYGRSGSFESYIAGTHDIPYTSGTVEAAVIANYFGGEEPLYATNDGATVRWFGTDCRYLSATSTLSEHPPSWAFPPVTDGELRDQGEWCVVSPCGSCEPEPDECGCFNDQWLLFEIQDVAVLHGRYEAAIILWWLHTRYTFVPVDFHHKDVELGITPPTSADTGGYAVTDFDIFGRDIGLIAFGGVDAESGDVVEFLELSNHSPLSGKFKRGNANADNRVDIGDAITILGYLFGAAGDPSKAKVAQCRDAADANDDGKLDVADAIKTLSHLFAQAGPLPEPFTACGIDPTSDAMGCESFPPCEGP